MSEKRRDSHNRYRSVSISFRLSPEERDVLDRKVRLSGLTKREYLAHRCLEEDILVQGNPRVYKALRSEMEVLCEQFLHLAQGCEPSPELLETVRVVTKTYEGMKNGN